MILRFINLKEFGYDTKGLTMMDGLYNAARFLRYSSIIVGVGIDWYRNSEGQINDVEFATSLSITALILFATGYGIPTYIWHQSLPQYYKQQQQAIDTQKVINYPFLSKYGF